MFKKVIVWAVVVLTLSGCVSDCSENADTNEVIVISTESTNWDYISFVDMSGAPSENANVIGNAISHWEEEHSDRDIIDLQIVYKLHSYARSPRVDGISIYSKPKPKQ